MKKKIVIMIAIILVLILVVLGIYLNNIQFFNPAFRSSENKMLAVTQTYEDSDQVATFYFIFDKGDKCTSSFVEFENPTEEILNLKEDAENGYIKFSEEDNKVYAEYTGLRGKTYDEIKDSFKDAQSIKEWR